MRGTAGYLTAAVGESLGGGVTEVGSLKVGGEVVEERDVVYLEWVSWFWRWKEEGVTCAISPRPIIPTLKIFLA